MSSAGTLHQNNRFRGQEMITKTNSGVARISREEEHTLRKFLGDTADEIHAINSDKAIGLYIFCWVCNQIEFNVRDSEFVRL